MVIIDKLFEDWDCSYSVIEKKNSSKQDIKYQDNDKLDNIKILIIGQWGGQQSDRLKLLNNSKLLMASQQEKIELIFRPHPLAMEQDKNQISKVSKEYAVRIDFPLSEASSKSKSSLLSTIREVDIQLVDFHLRF